MLFKEAKDQCLSIAVTILVEGTNRNLNRRYVSQIRC